MFLVSTSIEDRSAQVSCQSYFLNLSTGNVSKKIFHTKIGLREESISLDMLKLKNVNLI